MSIPVTKTTEFEQILKVMTGLKFSPYDKKGNDVRAGIIACPDPDQQAVLVTVFAAVKLAFDMLECVDNVREAIKRTETHYHVIAADVEDHFKLLQKCIQFVEDTLPSWEVAKEDYSETCTNGHEILIEWVRLRADNDLLKIEELEKEIKAQPTSTAR